MTRSRSLAFLVLAGLLPLPPRTAPCVDRPPNVAQADSLTNRTGRGLREPGRARPAPSPPSAAP